MGKNSDAKKGKKSGIAEQDEGENSDAKRGEGVVDSSRHERKEKRKRKRDISGVASDVSEDVKGDVNAYSKREGRKKKKRELELDNDRDEEIEKPWKDGERRRGDNGGIRSESEGVSSEKKKKKHKHNSGDDKSAVREGEETMDKGKKKKEDSKQGQGEGSTDQPDSRNWDGNKEEEKKNKQDKKKKKEKGKKKRKEEDKTEKEQRKEKERKAKKDKPARESSRKVRFADDVEIFPSSNSPSEEDAKEKHQLVHGKRFTPEEDELLKKAVYNYIEDHGLGEDGLTMVLQCSKHAETRGKCWKEIAAALPWRPPVSVQYRAHVLFERSETRSWTEEEYELIKRFHAQHGSDWRTLADALQKHRIHVKDTWRRINPTNLRKGHWIQEEYQGLFDLVNKDLQMRAIEEKVSDNRLRRDNICWEAISKKLTTRSNSSCCVKWYEQLSSPMVAEGIWTDADDYRLLNALVSLDACSMEEVEWDYLVEDRHGDVCRKRWFQMVRHIGEHGKKSFVEQVEILSERYCPDLLEVREAVDKKRLED